VTDVSGAYAMLNIQGPGSRALLQTLSATDFSNAAFPFGTCREIQIGTRRIPARASLTPMYDPKSARVRQYATL
jgi:glycine cleavage system aminomethyltransferase T